MKSKLPSLERFGFKFGRNGVHAARTMMFDEVCHLFDDLPETASRADYTREIVESNVLGKATTSARKLTLGHLVDLYGLSPDTTIFRVFRHLWSVDVASQPALALSMALARDPLLRISLPFILGKQVGETIERKEVEDLLESHFPQRFSPASRKSFAQNLNGTWTRAGYLHGRSKKTRSSPTITPVNAAFNLFLGTLEGLTAQRLFTSTWAQLLVGSPSELPDHVTSLALSAANRDLLVFRNAGGVMEVRFPGYLTPEEEQWLHE